MTPPFPHYPTTPESMTSSAAGILLSAGRVDRVRATLKKESKQAQDNAEGDIKIPLAKTPLPVDASADSIKLNARFASGALSMFAEAIREYDSGVDRLNKQWNALPADATRVEREALRKRLIRGEAKLQATLDGEANTVNAMMRRGPNDRDIRVLDSAGLMPSEDLQLGPKMDAPPVVKVGDEYVVMGSDEAEHVQVSTNEDGSLTVRVGTLVDGEMSYETVRIPPGQRDLEIRTYGGNDVIEVPPEVQLSIRAYAGSGDDNYFGGGHPGASTGGSGDDYINLGEGDDVAFGGAGDDTIIGGDGRDVIDGQDGQDTMDGGAGDDTIYGGRGHDTLKGGRGGDYVEGGSGNDRVDGGHGDDTLSGGRGDDVIDGGAGDDTMFGGRGHDFYDGGDGYDNVTAEEGETARNSAPPRIIELTGSPGDEAIHIYKPDWMTDAQFEAWKERIDSDLELIRTTPSGREGLEALDTASAQTDKFLNPFDSPKQIMIAPYSGEGDDENANDGFSVEDWLQGDDLGGNFASPPGGVNDDNAFVNYGATHDDALDERPPAVSLYHELAHSYDQLSGGTPEGDYTEQTVDEDGNVISENTAPRSEINAVGVDVDGDGDYDTIESGDGSSHPGALTENALRDDLGWDNRESYTVVPDADEDVVVIFEDEDGNEHRVTVPD